MNIFSIVKKLFGVLLAALVAAANFTPQMQALKELPGEIYIEKGALGHLPFEESMLLRIGIQGGAQALRVSLSGDQSLEQAQAGMELSSGEGNSKLSFNLFGVLPVRTISVRTKQAAKLVPGGHSIGVSLYTKGALLVGISAITTPGGESVKPAEIAGMQPGDIIEKFNGIIIENADFLSALCNQAGDAPAVLEIKRGTKTLELTIVPARDARDGKLRMGLWVRDSTAGVGTLTYYDPTAKWYAALGHAITDIDTKSNLSVKNGEIVSSNIIDIIHGEKGEPGELKGSFSVSESVLGNIEKNTDFGIYGEAHYDITNPLYPEALPVADQSEVCLGAASILTTLDNRGIREYACEIQRVTPQQSPASKGMVVRITDPELLAVTGGIVQGMSGSPILQNGKIVGAITHVFVNDPTRGYGMYIEWMMQQLEEISAA